MMIDSFFTIENQSEALLKEKSSKFYAYAYPVSTTESVDQCLSELKKAHLKARHFCYAFVLGVDKQNFRANDDGEPSGTAGRPILGQIEKRDLVDTLVVVVRYFGGTKLGTSGLIKAYKESAALALDNSQIIEKLITNNLTVKCTYENIGTLMSIISSKGFDIVDTTYEESVAIVIKLRLSEIENAITYIKSRLLNRSMEDIMEDTEVDDVTFAIS
jgi:uncharacterized YigZ family protein